MQARMEQEQAMRNYNAMPVTFVELKDVANGVLFLTSD